MDARALHGGTVNKFSADRLIKLDMPEFEGDPVGGSLRLEIYDDTLAEWVPAAAEKVAADGRLLLRFEGSGLTKWIDVTRTRYRWLVGEVASAVEEAPPEALGE